MVYREELPFEHDESKISGWNNKELTYKDDNDGEDDGPVSNRHI